MYPKEQKKKFCSFVGIYMALHGSVWTVTCSSSRTVHIYVCVLDIYILDVTPSLW